MKAFSGALGVDFNCRVRLSRAKDDSNVVAILVDDHSSSSLQDAEPWLFAGASSAKDVRFG
jgi:hypothetical protein